MSDDLDDTPDEETGLGQGRRLRKSPTAFRTISEVADELHVPQHVLRFWETKFPQVKPLKRGGGRRYYRPDDLALLKRISDLLYTQGYTIKGVQRLLREGRPDEDVGAAGETVTAEIEDDGEIELSQVSDEEMFQVMRRNDDAGEESRSQPLESETERLRAALRDALAALEALRAMLG